MNFIYQAFLKLSLSQKFHLSLVVVRWHSLLCSAMVAIVHADAVSMLQVLVGSLKCILLHLLS